MKKKYFLVIGAMLLVVGIACGGDKNPKALAKEMGKLFEQMMDLKEQMADLDASDVAKLTKLSLQWTKLQEQVDKLSEEDQAVFMAAYSEYLVAYYSGVALTSSGKAAEKPAKTAESGGGGKANPATDFRYDMNKAGDGVVIQGFLGNGGEVKIPAKIEGFPVTGILFHAFLRATITSVTIPDSVTVIGDGAFSQCGRLATATLPKNLKEIPTNLFSSCKSLESINIPDSVTVIGAHAFVDCVELSKVTLPSHPIEYPLHVLGRSDAFVNCPKLSLAVRKTITDTGYKGSF
jgi:hypothetical protein